MPGFRLARAVGIVLTLACLIFFVRSLMGLDLGRLLALPVDGLGLALGLSIVIYAGLLVIVASGFVHLVRASGHAAARANEALIVWGQANIAKYLPGNVFHFAGRQLLGRRYGWPQPAIAAATVTELALQVMLPSALAAAAFMATGWPRLSAMPAVPLWLLPLLLAPLLLALVLVLVLHGGRARRLLPARLARHLAVLDLARPMELCPAIIYQLGFFIGMTLIALAFYGLLEGALYADEMPCLVAAFLASWVLGLVVPGAPGGIGVREGSFVFLAGAALEWDSLVLVALLLRVVTLGGEGMLFLLATALAGGRQDTRQAASWPRPGHQGVPHARPLAANSDTSHQVKRLAR